MLRMVLLVVGVHALVWGLSTYERTSDAILNEQQEGLLRHATADIGMPSIVNFHERKMLKQILEFRDRAINTTTYIVDSSGQPHKICDSVGYGLPYSAQFTNPSQSPLRNVVVGQAEPNGVFSPLEAEGTWISCRRPTTQDVQLVYIEPRVIVSPFPLLPDCEAAAVAGVPIGSRNQEGPADGCGASQQGHPRQIRDRRALPLEP
jgi:hypothetical protein